MKAKLGTWVDGGQATIDLPRLLETRMLIQANSGGGKSWAIRRLLEQTAGQVQQLVIDPEGEFATLREKFDYVIAAAHDGDAVARTAIDEQTPYQRSSRDAYLARLRAKELVEEPSRGMVRASEVLFQ